MADAVHLGQAAEGVAADTAGLQTQRHAHTHTSAGFQLALMHASQGNAATDQLDGAVHHAVARVPHEEASSATKGQGEVHHAVARVPHEEASSATEGHGEVHHAVARVPREEASSATKGHGAVHHAVVRVSREEASSATKDHAVHHAVARAPHEEASSATRGHGTVHHAAARAPHEEASSTARGHGAVHHAVARVHHNEASRATKSYGAVHRAVMRVPQPPPIKPAVTPPDSAIDALSEAMTLEGVPASWQPGLTFIMAQESGGEVGVHSPIHSARGLYQLTAANYHYNPRGAASFGHAVEEAQGGIRYIRDRYGTADNAMAFWHRHRWY